MRTSVWTRVAGIGLAACAVAGLAVPASGQTLHRDGSKAVPFVAHVGSVGSATAGVPALRRDGSRAVPFVADVGQDSAAPAGEGFAWGDAAIGAAAALGLVALAGAGLALHARLSPSRGAIRRSKATAT